MAEIINQLKKTEIVQKKAEERYYSRTSARKQNEEKIKNKRPLENEPKERVETRMNLLNPSDGLAFERIIGSSDLLGINYLDLGVKSAMSVCRIQVRDLRGRLVMYGTGFLVSKDLMLTNNHVLESIDLSRRSLADFNFEDDSEFVPKETKTFALDPERFFRTDADLDFTLVAIRPEATDGTPVEEFGHLRLLEESGKALLGEYVTIIQHPEGGAKQITLRENQVVDLPEAFIHYHTDTKPGSSGSPVFNDQWEVVALHHSGVQKKDDKGRTLSTDGGLWEPSMGEDKIAWKANEGVRISSICAHLRDRLSEMTSEQQRLLSEVLSASPSAVGAPVLTDTFKAVEQAKEWYEGSAGYDPDFLGKTVPLPKISDELKNEIGYLTGTKKYELKYTHFSVAMNARRRLAFYAAVNIDGNSLIAMKRTGDKWYFDPRIDRKCQSGPELYDRNDLDRGHLVRRLDPVWGQEAEEANEDTFHFTNCAPQHKNLNQQTWQNLENYILKNAEKHGLKVTVFTGPVFRDDDMIYRGKFQIPAEYWKVVAIVKDNGSLSATAYLQTQKNLMEDLEFAYGKYRTYQIPVSRIEALTRLDFGKLRDHDPLGKIEGTLGRVITGPDDIRI